MNLYSRSLLLLAIAIAQTYGAIYDQVSQLPTDVYDYIIVGGSFPISYDQLKERTHPGPLLGGTVKIVLLHGVCSPKILCIYTIMQLRCVLLLVTHCDLLKDVTDKPVLQSCPSRILNSLPSNLILH